ncbi:right-handed parallel beta-helix repeat-containing protein, partial [Leptospira sp. 2 VSF17]|uniref:right-handed parallel beta-helix repeat-containing protein n=1 Tax=Leptospira soteropolitanensis TaxID=2950025 RepID=UPI00223E5D3E
SGTSGGYGILVYKTESARTYGHCVIAGNVVKDTQGSGIYVQGSPECAICGNRIEKTCRTQTEGDLLVGGIAVNAGPASITGNVIRTSGKNGIVV